MKLALSVLGASAVGAIALVSVAIAQPPGRGPGGRRVRPAATRRQWCLKPASRQNAPMLAETLSRLPPPKGPASRLDMAHRTMARFWAVSLEQ